MNEQEIREKIKELLIDSLGIEAEVLTDDVPLFGDGIGLDSIDSLEMIEGVRCINDRCRQGAILQCSKPCKVCSRA